MPHFWHWFGVDRPTSKTVWAIALSVSIALAVLRFKTVLLKTEVLEFNTQLRTKLNAIAV